MTHFSFCKTIKKICLTLYKLPYLLKKEDPGEMSAPGSKRRGNEYCGSANPRGDLALLVITSQCKHTGAETSCQEKIEKFSCFLWKTAGKAACQAAFPA